jgi:hypothetical protein
MKCLLKLTINKNVGWLLHIDPLEWLSLEFFKTYVSDLVIY